MNKTVKTKALIDGAMGVLFLLLMYTSITGIALHEILGVAMLALFIMHLILNRKWLGNIFRRLKAGATGRQKGAFFMNAAIAAATSTCAVTGIMISQYLFAPLGQSSSGVWYDVHDISAWVSLSLLALHGVLHWQWIAGVLKQVGEYAGKAKAFIIRTGAGLLAAGTVFTLFSASPIDRLLPSASGISVQLVNSGSTQDTSAILSQSSAETQTATSGQAITGTAQPQPEVTLNEYLSKLYCTACHKHCPLTNLRCARGRQQVEQATQAYNETIASA